MPTKASVDPGVCRYMTTIEVTKIDKKTVTVEIISDCKNLGRFREAVKQLSAFEPVIPRADSVIFAAAATCKLHPACPVPTALMKAIEIERGLALLRDVSITFEKLG